MHDSTARDSVKLGSVERDAYDVPEVAERLGVGEHYVWVKLIRTGELPSFKLGRLRKVAAEDLAALISRLREEDLRLRSEFGANA